MKKSCLLLFGLLLSLSSFAQEGIHFSIAGQPQNTWMFNTRDTDVNRSSFSYEFTWGWAAIGKLGYNFAEPIGFRIGCLYSVQGQSHTSRDSTETVISKRRQLKYIKIPLMLHINSDVGPVMFSFEVGPQLGFLIAADHFEADNLLNYNFDTVDLYVDKDVSVAWNIGADFRLTDWLYFNIHHRGDYSIFDIENKEFTLNGNPFYPDSRDKTENCTLGFMGGFTFCGLPRGGRGGKWWIR